MITKKIKEVIQRERQSKICLRNQTACPGEKYGMWQKIPFYCSHSFSNQNGIQQARHFRRPSKPKCIF